MTSENLLAAFTTTIMDFHSNTKNSQSCLRTQKMNSYGWLRRATENKVKSGRGGEITQGRWWWTSSLIQKKGQGEWDSEGGTQHVGSGRDINCRDTDWSLNASTLSQMMWASSCTIPFFWSCWETHRMKWNLNITANVSTVWKSSSAIKSINTYWIFYMELNIWY